MRKDKKERKESSIEGKAELLSGMAEAEKALLELQSRKDVVDQLARDIIRLSGKAVVLVHNKKTGEAQALMQQAKKKVLKLCKLDSGLEYYSLQAKQEYVEAFAFIVFASQRRLIAPGEAGVGYLAYLLGMLDLVGEIKRDAIDALMNKDVAYAELCYNAIKHIYDSTLPLKFANSIAPDFRRKQDTARIQLESLANELAGFERQDM